VSPVDDRKASDETSTSYQTRALSVIQPIRILFVEDSPEDAELEEAELRQAGIVFASRRVETRQSLLQAFSDFKPDLVISDHSLPDLSGLEVLRVVREVSPDLPFIFVSGTMGEDRAVESLKNGATDYVIKGRLAGFAVRVRRALKEAEDRETRKKLEAQYRQVQKMEALGRLAGGVAHDFNNLLTVIVGYADLLHAETAPGASARDMLQQICESAQRGSELTRQLLAFSRKQVSEPRILDLNAVVERITPMLSRLIGEDVRLDIRLGEKPWTVSADPGLVDQAIMNLAVNARDAMPRGGQLRIETRNVKIGEGEPGLSAQARSGRYVMLALRDSGVGMDAETQSHMFEPFFTTKEIGKGTGLGLSTVLGIVEQAGGWIECKSELGRGTTFKIFLPDARRPPSAASVIRPGAPVARGTGTVLLAEDSDVVRKLTQEMLTQAGYKVLSASGGGEALKLLESHNQPVDILITDTVMPGMSGPELVIHARRLRPSIKVLLVSGYVDREAENFAVHSDAAFLAKPYTRETLTRKVRDILEGQAGGPT
jgi:two-component system, cell cycle sensor histidine kinase and response regulator CckA